MKYIKDFLWKNSDRYLYKSNKKWFKTYSSIGILGGIILGLELCISNFFWNFLVAIIGIIFLEILKNYLLENK